METGSDDHFVVETPENIRFGYDVADIGSRFLAVLIDSIIQGALYVLVILAAVILAAQLSQTVLPRLFNDLLAVAAFLTVFLIQFGYFILFELIMNGQTPGKRLFNLRVIKDNAYPLSPISTIIRNLVRIIDFFPVFYGIGIIVMFFNKRAKRLGDYAAGTIVVKMRDQVHLQNLLPAANAFTSPTAAPAQGVEHLTEQDIELAESLLNRRKELLNPNPLTLQMAQQLAHKMNLPPASVPTNADAALTFIRTTVNTYRARP